MGDTPLLLAIHELNIWLDECKELERGILKGFGDFDGQEWLHYGCSGCDYCRHPHPNWDSVLTYLDC